MVVLLLLWGMCTAAYAEKARNYNTPEGAESVSKAYEGEATIMCSGKNVNIPEIFNSLDASPKEKLYLTANCTDSNIYVYFSNDAHCEGKPACNVASFISEKLSGNLLTYIGFAFAEKVKVSTDVGHEAYETGYYFPSRCKAMDCTETKMIWSSSDRIFIIGTKTLKDHENSIKEMKKIAESLPVLPQEETPVYDVMVYKRYQNDSSVACGGKTIAIPSYFPHAKYHTDDVYIRALCLDARVYVKLGFGGSCDGQSVCNIASYHSEKISSALRHELAEAFESSATTVPFSRGNTGYFYPAKCYAYCNESQLFWFSGERISIIGTNNANNSPENIAELKKSAESIAVENK